MLLQVEGLCLVSDEGVIVEHLSFTIDHGEIVALTGKSGSGKTNIGLAILGLIPSGIHWQEGNICWFGKPGIEMKIPRDMLQWAALRGSQIGYIQQDVFGIFDPVIRMGRQMSMIIKESTLRSSFDVEAELRSKLAEVGITDIDRIWNSYPHQLSGGQLQRCQICLSIVIQPLLIIADEPTSAIDKINQVELLDLLAQIRDQYHIAILCITHEESVVEYLADRKITLDEEILNTIDQKKNSILNSDPEEKPILEVMNLGFTHRFGGVLDKEGAKINGLSFTLHEGQCLGIIGESGSGKSTLAQLLVGLLTPSEGYIKVKGHQIDFMNREDIWLLRSKIQLVMQDGRGSLHPNLTIRTLLQEVIDQRRKKEKDLKIDLIHVLDQVGLSSLVLDRKEGSVSGGECLRISIARALLMQPDILICDESTSSLDGQTRDGIMELLLSLMRDQKLGLILISHDDSIIRWMSDDILVMEKGEIVEKGETQKVLDNPIHPVTQKIFSANATLNEKRNH